MTCQDLYTDRKLHLAHSQNWDHAFDSKVAK